MPYAHPTNQPATKRSALGAGMRSALGGQQRARYAPSFVVVNRATGAIEHRWSIGLPDNLSFLGGGRCQCFSCDASDKNYVAAFDSTTWVWTDTYDSPENVNEDMRRASAVVLDSRGIAKMIDLLQARCIGGCALMGDSIYCARGTTGGEHELGKYSLAGEYESSIIDTTTREPGEPWRPSQLLNWVCPNGLGTKLFVSGYNSGYDTLIYEVDEGDTVTSSPTTTYEVYAVAEIAGSGLFHVFRDNSDDIILQSGPSYVTVQNTNDTLSNRRVRIVPHGDLVYTWAGTAYHKTGLVLTSTPFTWDTTNAFTLDADGNFYKLDVSGILYSYGSTGTERWHTTTRIPSVSYDTNVGDVDIRAFGDFIILCGRGEA